MNQHQTESDFVTTEPQRKALEAMSRDLVDKLNIMVAEQEARAREFAAHQHSLSALPTQQPLHTTVKPQVAPTSYRHEQPVAPQYKPAATPPPPQYFPPIPQAPQPTVIRKKKKEEEGVGSTAIIIFLVIVFIIISRGCS